MANKYNTMGVVICPADKIFMRLKELKYTGKMKPTQHYKIAADLITDCTDRESWQGDEKPTPKQQELFDFIRIIMFRASRHTGQKDVTFLGYGLELPKDFTEEPPFTVAEIEDFKNHHGDKMPNFKPADLRFYDTNNKLIAPDI